MGGKGAAGLSVRVFSMPVVEEWEYCHAFIVAGRGWGGAMIDWVEMRVLTSVGGCMGTCIGTLVRERKG